MINFDDEDIGENNEEICSLIDDAEDNAESDWEINFVDSIRAWLEEWGDKAMFSDRQVEKLREISERC